MNDSSSDDVPQSEFGGELAADLIDQVRMAAVGETAALLSHQINNVLQGINGGSHLVEVGLKKSDLAIVARGWATVSKNQLELSELISDLQELGKPLVLTQAPADFVEITQKSLDGLSEFLQFNEVAVEFGNQPGALRVNVDMEAIQIAIAKMIRVAANACRGKKRRLTISLEESNLRSTLRIGYRGAVICLDPQELLIPDRDEVWFIGGIDFAVARKIFRGHHGDIQISQTSDQANLISVSLPAS